MEDLVKSYYCSCIMVQISHQLENKFGKQFAQDARSNLSGTVNPKVIHRLGVEAPKKSLVENYMIEIARNYKVEYEPETTMFMVSVKQAVSHLMAVPSHAPCLYTG